MAIAALFTAYFQAEAGVQRAETAAVAAAASAAVTRNCNCNCNCNCASLPLADFVFGAMSAVDALAKRTNLITAADKPN